MSAIRRGAGDAPGDQLGAAGGDGPVAGGAAGDEPRPAGDADRHRPGHHPQEPQGELQVLPGQEADEAQDGEGPDPDPGAGGGGRESGRHEVVASDLRLHSLRCHSACYHCSASYQYLVYKNTHLPYNIFVTFIKYENAKYILYSQHTCCNKVITIKMSGSLKMSLRRNVLSNCRHCLKVDRYF